MGALRDGAFLAQSAQQLAAVLTNVLRNRNRRLRRPSATKTFRSEE
jgi:hypothetical protein